MNKSISIAGNIQDKNLIEDFVNILKEKGYDIKIYYPHNNSDAYIGALESYNLILCITPNSDKTIFELAKDRPVTGMETIGLFLEITLLNPRQEEALKDHKKIDYTINLNEASVHLLKDLGLEEVSSIIENENTTSKEVFKDTSLKERYSQGKKDENVPPLVSTSESTIAPQEFSNLNKDKESYNSQSVLNIYEEPKKKRTGLVIGIILAVICLGGAIFGWFYYDNVYLPEKIDREAPRTYPMVNVFLRSSKMAGGDFNKIATVPGSDELITYEDDGEWAKVKYIPHGENAKPMVGYVASDYLLNKRDLYQLTSMLSDNDVREVLATSKVRKGLIDYYNRKGITGKISQENAQEVGLPYSPSDQWQVMFHRGQTKPNEVYFKRVYNPDSKFTDMAVIIENVSSGAKKLLYFTYDDDETPHLRAEGDYHNGVIKDMKLDSGVLQIIDKDGQISYYQIS